MKRWQGRRQRTWRQVAGPAAAATLSLRRRAATRGPGVPALGTATVSALAPTAPPPDTTRHAGGWDALVQNQLACPPRTTPCNDPHATKLAPGKEKEPWVRSTRRARSRASVSPARRWPSSTWRRTGFLTAESCPMAPECPRKRFCRRSRAPASPASSGSWMGLRGPAVSSWPAASSGRCWGPCGPARLQDASPRHQGRERPYRPHHSDLRLIAFWSGRCSRTPSTRTSWDPSISSRVDPLPWQVSSRLVSGDPAA